MTNLFKSPDSSHIFFFFRTLYFLHYRIVKPINVHRFPSRPFKGHARNWESSNLDTTQSGDSSFAFSWGDVESEFEQNATKKVLQLYENIQCHSYLNSDFNANLIQENLITECKVWQKYFPHLRVVGHQILPSTEDFIQLIETDRATPYETSAIYPEINMLELIGSCMNFYVSPLSEEILHQAGVYEEYFAFDSSPTSPDGKNSKAVEKRSKFPPTFPLQSRGSITTNAVPKLPPDPHLDLQYILSPPTTAGTGYNTVKPFQYQQTKPFHRNSDSSTGILAQHRPRTLGRKGQLKPLQDNNKNSNNTTGILGSETNSTGQIGLLESGEL
ncbi:hypothetical protein LOD99_14492 [Oopsacas minuta]|uniref:DUF3719 domain-containing protein n=1 Tax=Oopsacas minuta TaxID=111878 RepID=A0AAV7KHH2_9METZ|nr:hypothetical protein LOD99_14492 [Oopsacas minuta]